MAINPESLRNRVDQTQVQEKLTQPSDTPDTVKAETKETLQKFYSEKSLELIGVSVEDAKKLAESLGINSKENLEKYQEDHNIGIDGTLGKETYIEMKTGKVLEDFDKKDFQKEILFLLEEGNMNGLNLIELGCEIGIFKEKHKNDKKYETFFNEVDCILGKKVAEPLSEQDEKDKKNNSNGNSILGKGGVLDLSTGKITKEEFWENNKDSITTLGFGIMIFSLIFGIPSSTYEKIPGGGNWYTRIPLLIGFMAIGGGDLVGGLKDKLLSDISGENSESQTQAVQTVADSTGQDTTTAESTLNKFKSKINESVTDDTERLKNGFLSNIFASDLGNKRIEEIDGVTTINGLGLSERNKKILIDAGITNSDITKFISILVSKSTGKAITINKIIEGDSNKSSGLDINQLNSDNNQQGQPEQLNEKLDDISDNQLIDGLNLRLEKFKEIAQKTEDLETLGIAWNEEENIEKYKKELNTEHLHIIEIIGQLRQREVNNPNISEILDKTYIFLSRYYAGGSGKLDNDHLRNYKISSIMALGILKKLDGCPEFPNLNDPNFEKEIQKFDIDLEYFLDTLEGNNDPLIKEAASIVKDNRGIGWLDFQEETTDAILDNLGGTAAVVGATATIILASPGILVGSAIVGGAALTGTTINTISRGKSDGVGQFVGEMGVLGFQSVSAGGLGLLSKFLLAKNFSTLAATGIIGAEMVGDVAIVGMAGDALKSEVFNYDYNLGESFTSNLAWAPLALIGGLGSVKNTMRRARIKQAIGDNEGMIKEVELFGKEISNFKKGLVGKTYDIEVDGVMLKVEIGADGKILTKLEGEVVVLDKTADEKIIKGLAVEINNQLLVASNPRLAGAFRNIEFKKNFESGLNGVKDSYKWVDGKLHYFHVGSYLEKIPFVGTKILANEKFKYLSKATGGVLAFTLSDDEIGDILLSISEDELVSKRTVENLGAIAGNFYGMYKFGIISSVAWHNILEKLGIKENGFMDQVLPQN